MTSLINLGVFFFLLTNGALGRFLPTEIFRNSSNADSSEERQENCNCEWRFFQHYEAKGCRIVQSDSCGCPVNYVCSSVKHSVSEEPKVCMYQSVEYKVGEKIQLADNCKVCRCEGGVTPQVVCRQRECPQLAPGEGENCHLVYERNKCCPSRYECIGYSPENSKETSGITCLYNGITYPLGAKIFPPDDPCTVCECHEDWTGVNNSSCYQQECVIERKKHLLDAGCIPIYHERRCCPIEYFCPEDLSYNSMTLRELAVENSTKDEASCIIGENSYEIGAELSYSQKKSCVKCTCQVPPDFTCVHQSCSLPPNGENCVRIRSPDQCCPTYDCLLGDSALTETSDTENDDSEPSTTEGACPTPLCADDSCQIEIPPGHECPTCVCGEAREKNDFEPVETPFEQYYEENNNETEGANVEKQTLETPFEQYYEKNNNETEGVNVEKQTLETPFEQYYEENNNETVGANVGKLTPETPFEQYYEENNNEAEGANVEKQTLSAGDDSENEILSKIFDEKSTQQKANFENFDDDTEIELQTGGSTQPDTEEYFMQFQSRNSEDVANHLAPNELRRKRSENMETAESQAQQTQQQWNVLQEDEDEMEPGETIHSEREFSEESSEGFDELQAFGSRGRHKTSAVSVGSEDQDSNNVMWRSIVPGCPTPLCANSSCRIGVLPGHQCPTCICKRARQP